MTFKKYMFSPACSAPGAPASLSLLLKTKTKSFSTISSHSMHRSQTCSPNKYTEILVSQQRSIQATSAIQIRQQKQILEKLRNKRHFFVFSSSDSLHFASIKALILLPNTSLSRTIAFLLLAFVADILNEKY